jgi:hypothetical protein
MPRFTVTLTLTVDAESTHDACGIGIGAAEHLVDTFNDDKSVDSLVNVEARPEASPDPLRLALREALALLEDPDAEPQDADRVAATIRRALGLT